jgi:hypothetical protein
MEPEVFVEVKIKTTELWVMTVCNFIGYYQYFEGTCCLLFQEEMKTKVPQVVTKVEVKAVSHWLLTRQPGFNSRSFHVGFMVD